jgi:hypothetical protein
MFRHVLTVAPLSNKEETMGTVYLGHEIIRCGRDLILIQKATGNEEVRKGETKDISLGYVAETLNWYCKQDNDETLEHQDAPEEKSI